MAALQSLHREGELLPSTQREVLAAMLREHGAAAAPHAHAADASLSHSRRSFSSSASPDGGGLASHLVASSQTPPGMPRQSNSTTRRPSELGPAISGMCCGFLGLPVSFAAHDCPWKLIASNNFSKKI